jgi:broad specificity phosphatase PhoE
MQQVHSVRAFGVGLAAGLMAIPSATTAQAEPGPTAIILVRHGEKALTPHENPPLSPAGQMRAQGLAGTLHDAGVTAIITTQQQRTRETAAPLAERLRLAPVTVPTTERPDEHAEAVAAAVRRAGGVVLVVDHQLTLPLIIKALGGPTIPTMCDVEFSNLYVLVPDSGESTRLVDAHYGAPDPPHGPRCTITPRSPP